LRQQLGSSGLGDVPSVLDVLDVPPGQLCLPRARLCVTGWVEEIPAEDQRKTAAAAAEARPLGCLLDVGSGWTLYGMEPADFRLTVADGTHAVEVEEFVAASPDPLYEIEDEVVSHLELHHQDRIFSHALARLPAHEASRLHEVSVGGLDRYGLDLLCAIGAGRSGATSYTSLRSSFGREVGSESALTAALCQLLGCPCSAG
jgi:hypothetical protein